MIWNYIALLLFSRSKRQYPPLSLQKLQLMIDTNRINSSQPIDLASICNSKVFPLNPKHRHFGVNLTDEGADFFASKINIEVQHASEQAIAAIERNGGVGNYGIQSFTCLTKYFRQDSKREFLHFDSFLKMEHYL